MWRPSAMEAPDIGDISNPGRKKLDSINGNDDADVENA